MKIIKAGYKFISPNLQRDPDLATQDIMEMYKNIERAGRTCYKSEDKITDDSAIKFVKSLVKNGHEAMLEHANMSIKFIVDRGVSHELVRHRVASFAQESTRYCNYSKDKFDNQLTFIKPCYWGKDDPNYLAWMRAMNSAEAYYLHMLERGVAPEEARCVLPNSLKTEIVITANMREWRHIFQLRAAGVTGRPHPQMMEVMIPLLNECKGFFPGFFDDIIPLYTYIDPDTEED